MKKNKKLLCALLCGVVIAGSTTMNVSARTSDSCSGECRNAHVVGTANISRRSAYATTVVTGGNSGTAKVSCTNTYRDVSAGKTRTASGSANGTNHAQKTFNVYEEDYMKSLDTTHSVSINGGGSWSDSTNVKYLN